MDVILLWATDLAWVGNMSFAVCDSAVSMIKFTVFEENLVLGKWLEGLIVNDLFKVQTEHC